MKKTLQYGAALLLTLSVLWSAQNGSVAWAGKQDSVEARPNAETVIHEEGEYTIGGICTLTVKYLQPDLHNVAAVDVPAEESRKVTFSYPDDLYLAGCHITHFKENKFQPEMSSEQGEWEICFGNRPDEKLTIYYYRDDQAELGQAVWAPLPTTEKDTFVCAPALYSGVYAPGGIFIPQTGAETGESGPKTTTVKAGTVTLTVPVSTRIEKSGRYGAGGICELIVDYYVPNLANELHVEDDVEISADVPFPDGAGLLYLPGCHVYHYKTDELVDQVTTDEGRWEICFAAIPGKETTIYFYYADNDDKRVTSVWTPLETRVEGGTACAPLVNFTGVYTPVGK